MPHNRIAPVVLGAFLAVSLTPTGANATEGHPTDAADATAAHSAGNNADALETAEKNEASNGDESAATGTENAGDDAALNADTNAGQAENSKEGDASQGADANAGNAANVAENNAADTTTDDNSPTPEAAEDAVATIVRGSERLPFDSLSDAVIAAQSGDVIELARDQVLNEQIIITSGLNITLRATAKVTVTRSDSFPTSGGKIVGMFLVNNGASLTLEGAGETGTLTLDGEDKDSNDAIITLQGASTLTMGKGSAIVHAHCSWKPWGAVYVRSGTFVLDGGEIRDSFAMRNAAVAVEAGSSFEMRNGTITGSRASYSQTMVWTKGSVRMTGGTIAGNRSNVSSDGVVQVLSGGSFTFAGGTIGDNKPNNTFGMRVDAGGTLTLGAGARFEGTDRIELAQGATLSFTDAPAAHSIDDPIEVVLAGTWDNGALLATTPSPEVAREVLARLSVKRGGTPEQTASVGIDPNNSNRIALASSEVAAIFDVLDNPFTDGLALNLRDALTKPDAFDNMRNTVESHFAGLDTPEKSVRLQQIERLERYAAYLNEHREALSSSVIELSQLGNPGTEAQRTQQGYQFDNLDATGLYLKPGQVNEIVVYVEADDPSLLSVAWRQAGVTDTNHYTSLNLEQRSKLGRGENRITIDLTGKTYGSMLFLRNDSTTNRARVRVEAYDAPYVATEAAGDENAAEPAAGNGSAAEANPMLGTSLGEHPFYEHDPAHPERFWTFVQDIKAHADRAKAGEVADMTLLQMGDDGHAQFSITATALAHAYAGITSQEEAIAYIERSNKAIQDRLEFFWAFDGYNAAESGPNAISAARVHTAFTRTVTNPSTLYAFVRYFHMPESEAAPFLSGADMYSWGMSHEYGHMLDNTVISVGEETNNLYSLAGSRQGGIEASQAAGIAFDPKKYYHGNAIRAAERRDEELAQMAADPAYVPDWMNGGDWGTYIWTHVTTWWNALHFFDDWDYSGYDFSASPYTKEIAADVEKYGAYGATVRILRGNTEAVQTIKDLASNAASAEKYNRIAMAFTMGTGYNVAEHLYELGERDLAPQVLEWCAQYPSVPRAVRYFSFDTDAAIINGAKTYAALEGSAGAVAPSVTVQQTEGGRVQVKAAMATPALEQATTAYELYRNGTLIGFSRDGSFEVTADAGASGADAAATNDEGAGDVAGDAFDPEAYTVVAYDVRVNPSRAANVNGPVLDSEQPDGDNGEDEGEGNLPGGEEGLPEDGENGDTDAPDTPDNEGGEEQPGEDQPDGGEDSETPDDGTGDEQPGEGGDENQPENGEDNLPGEDEGSQPDSGEDNESPDGDTGGDQPGDEENNGSEAPDAPDNELPGEGEDNDPGNDQPGNGGSEDNDPDAPNTPGDGENEGEGNDPDTPGMPDGEDDAEQPDGETDNEQPGNGDGDQPGNGEDESEDSNPDDGEDDETPDGDPGNDQPDDEEDNSPDTPDTPGDGIGGEGEVILPDDEEEESPDGDADDDTPGNDEQPDGDNSADSEQPDDEDNNQPDGEDGLPGDGEDNEPEAPDTPEEDQPGEGEDNLPGGGGDENTGDPEGDNNADGDNTPDNGEQPEEDGSDDTDVPEEDAGSDDTGDSNEDAPGDEENDSPDAPNTPGEEQPGGEGEVTLPDNDEEDESPDGDNDEQPDGDTGEDNSPDSDEGGNTPDGDTGEEQPGEDGNQPDGDNGSDTEQPDGENNNQPGDEGPLPDNGEGGESPDNGTGEEKPGDDEGDVPGDEEQPDNDDKEDLPGNDGGDESPDGDTTTDNDEQPGEEEDAGDSEKPDADSPVTDDDLAGENDNGDSSADGDPNKPGSNPQPSNPSGNANAGSNTADQAPGNASSAANAGEQLPQTGDTALLPAGIAAVGSAIAFLGAAIARRFRKS